MSLVIKILYCEMLVSVELDIFVNILKGIYARVCKYNLRSEKNVPGFANA